VLDGHQRVNFLYERLNAQVLGVSRSDLGSNKQFAQWLSLEFPLASASTSRIGWDYGAYPDKPPFPPRFENRVVIMDKNGIVRYIRDGSTNFKEILNLLLKLEEECKSK
jgi:peroxiredoxin